MKLAHSKQNGQSLVETALVVPLLMLLLVGVVDLGRAMFTKMALANASREGARYGSHYPAHKAGVIVAVETDLAANGVDIDPMLVVLTLTPDPTSVTPAVSGEEIAVALVYPFDTILGGIIGIDPIQIGAETRMIVFGVAD